MAKMIVKLGDGEGRILSTFREGFKKLVGKGDRVSFCSDKWLEEMTLGKFS